MFQEVLNPENLLLEDLPKAMRVRGIISWVARTQPESLLRLSPDIQIKTLHFKNNNAGGDFSFGEPQEI
jgi:hypothetical protein